MPSQFITDFIEAVQPAAQLIQRDFWQTTRSASESKRDFQDIVTLTDKQSQELLVAGLTQLAQKHGLQNVGFIGEENGLANTQTDHIFIMDPIDGTTNFANRVPHCAISVGYAYQQEMVAGLIFQPLTGEYWWVEKGQGSWYINPKQQIKKSLQVIRRPLHEAVLATSYNSQVVAPQQFAWYQRLYNHVRTERNFGAMVIDLAYCAQNAIQGTTNDGCFIWDLAAGKLLLEEAGGAVLSLDGSSIEYNWTNAKHTYRIVAGHAETIREMLEYWQG